MTEAEEEIKAGLLMRQRSIKKNLIGFRKSLQDKSLAPMTIRLYMAGLKSFYRAADIELPSLPRAEKAIPLEKHIKIPSKEDLQEVLKICDPMERAVLLVGASSGLTANEIVDLKISDFENGYDSETGITTLNLRRKKVRFDFITFLSPEASKAVLGYINYRGRTPKVDCTRREKQLEKQKVYSINDYLFICRKVPNEFLKTKNEELRKLEVDALIKIYRVMSEKAQKNASKSDWNLIRSHNVRKWVTIQPG